MSIAHDVAEPTRRFARVLGPYFLVLSAVVAIRAPDMSALLEEFAASTLWPFVMGAFALLGGIAVVAFHQRWHGAPAVIVSVVGWLLVARGLFLLAFPDTAASAAQRLVDMPAIWLPAYVVMAVLGLYLTFVGYRGAPKMRQHNPSGVGSAPSHAT